MDVVQILVLQTYLLSIYTRFIDSMLTPASPSSAAGNPLQSMPLGGLILNGATRADSIADFES